MNPKFIQHLFEYCNQKYTKMSMMKKMKELDKDLQNLTMGYLRKLFKSLSLSSVLPISLKVIISLYAVSSHKKVLFHIDHLEYPHDIMSKSVMVKIKAIFHKIKIIFNESEYIDLILKNNEFALNCNDNVSRPNPRLQITTVRDKKWKYKADTKTNTKLLIIMRTNGRNEDGKGCICPNAKGLIEIYITQNDKLFTEKQVMESKKTGLIKLNVNDFMLTPEDSLILSSYGLESDIEISHMHQNYCSCDMMMRGPTETYQFPNDPRTYKIYCKSNCCR